MPKDKKKNDEPAKKRGNQSDMRAEHLLAELEGYCNASNAGKTRKWYPSFFRGYWTKFPWRIPFEEEPPDDLEEDNALDTLLSEDEKKIKRWFNYQRTHSGNAVNPWSKWIRNQLKPTKEERHPRRLLDYQVYMQDEGKNAAINAELQTRYPDKVGARDSIKWRALIARKMLAVEPEDVRDEFKKRGDDDFEEAMKEYEESEGSAANAIELDEDERAEARLRLVATVKPLLQAIREHTGYHVTLIAGAFVNGKVTVRSAHAGTVDGKNEEGQGGTDFTRWDPTGYKNNVVKQFMRYIAVVNGTPDTFNDPSSSTNKGPATASAAQSGATALPAPTMPPAPPPPSSDLPPMPTSTPTPMPPARAASLTPPPVGNLLCAQVPVARTTQSVDEGGDDDRMVVDDEQRVTTLPLADLVRLNVGSPLQREVMTMSEWERTLEGNMAKNKELLKSFNLPGEVAALMKGLRVEVKSPKRKHTGAEGGGDEEEYSGSDGESDEDENERDGTPTPAAKKSKTSAKGKRGRGKQTALVEGGVPEWPADGRVTLLQGGGGDEWAGLVDLWWAYEKSGKFVGPAKGKGTAKRLKEVSGWVGRARSGVVDLVDIHQPVWLAKAGEGDWKLVAQTGPNGMLNVLICLRWWYDGLKNDAPEIVKWREAVDDVQWAMKSILYIARSSALNHTTIPSSEAQKHTEPKLIVEIDAYFSKRNVFRGD
ncbi:hypothetical protein C8F04DRAFT_1193592 [Mycena alexandri]|uniref:Uncharacterized protein n=1 Tax=Mycena alexandri TaxID=1745969 RepID=A0AAD6S8W2_9AGAR|nr:hypothetical protein C8F04DRAFT_1193592 [Mycena alexandri]